MLLIFLSQNPIHSKVDKFGDPLLERIKVHVLLLSLLATLKNVKLQGIL